LLDVGHFKPERQENIESLIGLDHCDFLAGTRDDDPSPFIARHGAEWISLIKAGKVDVALAQIDGLPAEVDEHKLPLFSWRPRGDSNPGYRRERAWLCTFPGQVDTIFRHLPSPESPAAVGIPAYSVGNLR